MTTLGSILHGAYGDYYEQMLGLKYWKRRHPHDRLVLFFASESRLREMSVFDMSFADEVHLASAIGSVAVDRWFQYQVRDGELIEEVLEPKREFLQNLDRDRLNKPWATLRRLNFREPETHVGLSDLGRERLPQCFRDNGIDEALFEKEFTVGFLWRYRPPTVSAQFKHRMPEQVVRQTKSELLSELVERWGARVLVCGMNLKVTDENRTRIDNKYSDRELDLDSSRVTYLKGLSWGLELEILCRCSLCIVMPSGFSEALWIKRYNKGGVCLVDAPPQYLLRALYNRVPMFNLTSPRELFFQIRRPHTKERVLRYLLRRGMLPPAPRQQPARGWAPMAVDSTDS